jgi:hypothetical protein
MSITRIKEWYNRFKDVSTSEHSEPRHGRPSTSRNDNIINQVRTLVMQDRHIHLLESGLPVEETWRFERHLYSCASWHFAFFTTDGKRAVNHEGNQSQTIII